MVQYEWDVETVSAQETPDLEEGEVIDHAHQTSYAECLEWIARDPAPAGCRFEIVLVRDDDDGRAWAYMDAARLPARFHDASGSDTARVPARFVREVERAARAA